MHTMILQLDAWLSCLDDVGLVHGHGIWCMVVYRFVPYFRAATPEKDLADLNVGSRPAKRNPKGLMLLFPGT